MKKWTPAQQVCVFSIKFDLRIQSANVLSLHLLSWTKPSFLLSAMILDFLIKPNQIIPLYIL